MIYFGAHNSNCFKPWLSYYLGKAREGLNFIRGKNNTLAIGGVVIHSKIRIVGNENRIIIPSGSFVTNVVIVMVKNCVLILGNNVRFGGGNFWFREDNSKILISNNCTIESANLHAEEGCIICFGENCMLSYDIDGRISDSHSILNITSKERINNAKRCPHW
jgi:hypothetical protein